ncbi:Ste24 endopeptidase [Pseudodesulfovibrio profundus]|uniref:Ste24 endopeptidase n=1 Tax=Pseudodesulfovibrio profundus TaxID=57320 RepID=A0A2C8FBK7_9BACT|nr:M48 family metallopeptidase [Pseudodesulfovibrio profundus]SOB59881.1 Ste24 endopeptidase [Pseudodesulfovibrio profundus]
MNTYLVVILASLVLSWLLGIVSNYYNKRHMVSRLPDEFRDVYDDRKYSESQEYARANMRFSSIADSISMAITIGFILLGGFNWLDQLVRSWELAPLLSGLAYIGLLSLASWTVSLPFEIYQTFVLESRFQFNNTTPWTFVVDRLKGLILTAILGGGLLAGVLYFFGSAGEWAWMWCWVLAVAFSLGITYVAPTWILPLFNTFSPLEEGELRTALEAYARKSDFELEGIFVMDGSRRTSKGNAFFTGFGKRKRIALFDTLLKEQSVEEITAVLAHEVGHSKRGHIRKQLILATIKTGAVFYLLSLFLDSKGLFDAFGMEHMSVYAGLVFFTLLYTPISMVLGVVGNYLSRKYEFEADAFAAETTNNPGAMISALKKLSANNLSNLTPHPLVVWLEYSHPPVLERVRVLKNR